tara:strand:- start:242 stop:466 length:225 start_codon:yes stop_codon:yes gene_type:complete
VARFETGLNPVPRDQRPVTGKASWQKNQQKTTTVGLKPLRPFALGRFFPGAKNTAEKTQGDHSTRIEQRPEYPL